VNSENVSWIGSLLCIGGFCGAIFFGFVAQRFGKRVALVALAFPHFAFWLTIHFSTSVEHLYYARIFAGFTGGGALRTVSLFIAEISENQIRGKLGSYLILFMSFGTLLAFIAGNYLSFFLLPLVMMTLPACFFIAVLFLHDTPVSLMSRGKVSEAWESLKFYRSCGSDELSAEKYREEHELMRRTVSRDNTEQLELKDFREFSSRPQISLTFS
jgi:MFS family permease